MYDHTESTEWGRKFKNKKPKKKKNLNHMLHTNYATHRRALTATSWASLFAAVSTWKSCNNTVGRKLMMTCVSMACRHWGKEEEVRNSWCWTHDTGQRKHLQKKKKKNPIYCMFFPYLLMYFNVHLTFRYFISSNGLASDVVLISWQCWKKLCRCRSCGQRRSTCNWPA